MNPDDPKFTAHALGEFEDLTAAERAEIEALVASDPAALAEAEETRALAARLRSELTAEESGALHEEQRAAVFTAATNGAAKPKMVRFPFWSLAKIAALLMVAGVAVYLLLPSRPPAQEYAMRSAPPEQAKLALEQKPGDLGGLLASNVPTVPAPALTAPQLPSGALVADGIDTSKSALAVGSATPNLTLDTPTSASAPASAPTIAEIQALTADKDSQKAIQRAQERMSELQVPPHAVAEEKSLALNKDSADITKSPPSGLPAGAAVTRSPAKAAAWNAEHASSGTLSRFMSAPPTAVSVSPASPTADEEERTQFASKKAESGWQRSRYPNPVVTDVTRDNFAQLETAPEPQVGAAFDELAENAFLSVRANPLSTFSIDVDTASYSIIRRCLDENQRPPKGAVRIEELLNYFSYDYAQPEGDAPFSAAMEVSSCPWAPEHRLVRIGLKGREIARDKRPASNLVFLIDVSGSMMPQNKLPLLKQSLGLLIDQLGPEDQVSMVVYAGRSGCVLEPTHDKRKMHAALGRLEAGGSTNGASGVQLAYQIAEDSFIKGGTNRVILATDGDWNVGITDRGQLIDLIKREAKTGVFLTVLGVGMDNLNDRMLVKLADSGNGNYAYIDSLVEAKKVLVEQLSATLVTIAKDVKIQVEFNPAQVGAYRLIGYEKRMLKKQDFNDDKKDAGEIGAGHTVTALYEIVPAGQQLMALQKAVDPLKYQPVADPEPVPAAGAGAAAPAKPAAPAAASEPPVITVPLPPPASAPRPRPENAPVVGGARPLRPGGDFADAPVAKDAARPMAGRKLADSGKPAEMDKAKSEVAAETAAPDAAEGQSTIRDAAKAAKAAKAKEEVTAAKAAADIRNELLTLKLRYKDPEADTSKLLEFPLTDRGTPWEQSSGDFRFAAAVAGYGMLLRDSPNKGDTTWSAVAEWAVEGKGKDTSGYRTEFLSLIEKARAVSR